MDTIDITIARVFDVSPEMLYTTRRHERLALARFMAWKLRQERSGADATELALQYSRSQNEIWHGLKRAAELLKYNKDFRRKYELCNLYLLQNRVPFEPSLLKIGAKVWTRPDSKGNQIEGIVADINFTDKTFTIQSFEDTNLTIRALPDGRTTAEYETSHDIMEIEP